MNAKITLLFLFAFTGATTTFAQTATAPSAGAGTEASPYQITNVNQLYWIAQNTTRWSLHYTQTANIDASATSGWNSGAGFTPIGNNSVKFTGSYNGAGRTITGLTINRPTTDYVGLFGATTAATIQSVTLLNVSITGQSYVGALVGNSGNGTEITSSHVNSGTVSARMGGGLVGVVTTSTITLSSAKITVTGITSNTQTIGGLVAQNIGGTISRSYATGSVTGNGSTGGLLGYNAGGYIRNCYATGSVTGVTSGGLVGLNQYVNATVYGLVEYSYAIGTVTGSTYEGSLIGRHTAGSVITSSYFNSALSGLAAAVGNGSSAGATDLTSVQMRYKASFTGFNFTDNWYMLGEGAYFPTLVSNLQSPQPGRLLTNGSGTSGDPYLISNADELNAMRGYSSQYFKLTADIDLTEATGTAGGTYWNDGVGFIPISPPYNALKLDGDGHTINGLYMNNTTGNTGLFASLTLSGYVKNLHLTNVDITSTGSRVGGIVASLSSSYVTNSSVTGSITINNAIGRAGGIAGELIGPTSGTQAYVSNTFTDVALSGEGYYVGGIVGSLSASKSVTDSYSIGSIENTGYMSGGIAGLNDGTISRTYAIGEIRNAAISMGGIVGVNNGTITNSYWDPATTTRASGVGQGTEAGPVSLSMTDMRYDASFGEFDFETVWQSNTPNAFPTLRTTPHYPLPGYQPLVPTGSASLDGLDDWIDLPDSIATVLGNDPDMTLEAWVKMDYENQDDRVAGALFSVHTSSYVNVFILFISTEAATYGKFRVYEPNTYEIESPQLPNDTWVHVAYTLEGTTGRLYVDGTYIGQHTMNTSLAPTNRWSFGQEYDSSTPTNYSKLLVDEIRVWSRARTQDEIRRDMYQKLNGDEDGLVTYLPFDALTGTNPTDLLRGGASTVAESHPYGTYVTGSQGWRLMSSPLESVSYGTLFDPLWTQGFTGADVTHGMSNLQTWNEATRSYQSISNATDIPAAGAGFKFFFFDDEDKDETPDGFPKQIRNAATQRTGPVSPPVSYTDSGAPEDDGWNLVGNPYGTSIDWNAESGWTRTNLDATFYIWNDAADEYQSWNGLLGTTALANGLIAPWQGFWVKANAADPALTLTDEVRSSGAPLRKSTPPPHIRLRVQGEQRQSSTVVLFHPEAEPGKDRLDAYKLRPLGAEFLSLATGLADGTQLDIQALPAEMPEAVTIPLQLSGSHTSGAFGLNWELGAIPEEWILTLRDEVTGAQVRLNEAGTYEFAVAPTDTSARFTLTIDPGTTTGVEVPEPEYAIRLEPNYPNPFNPTTVIGFQLPEVGMAKLSVYDLLGREIAVLVDAVLPAGAHRVHFEGRGLASGIYIYRLETGGTILSRKMTLVK